MVEEKDNYNYQCSDYNVIADIWLCGSAEKDQNGKKFDGAYPSGFIKRLKTAFREFYPDDPAKVLHVCAGRMPPSEGYRLDIDPTYKPDFICNAEKMVCISSDTFFWVIADPPYNREMAKRFYGVELLNKTKMFKEMVRVCKVGGYIGILDQASPMLVKNVIRIAIIGVTSVPNRDLRIFNVFKKIS